MATGRSFHVSHDHAPVEIVDGYGAEIRVASGHLVLRNGDFGSDDRAERWIARGRSRLKRIVVLSHEGIVSLDALEWMSQLNVAMIVLDRNGRLTCCSSPEMRHDAELRRAQAVACGTGRGREIAAWIVDEKLGTQSVQLRKLIKSLPVFATDERRMKCEKAGCDIAALRGHVPRDLRGILSVEGRAAQIYWKALEGQAIPWPRKSADRVPKHWLQVQRRTSGANGLAQDARDPFNAALNYVLAVLEAECRIATAKVGLDCDFGFLHADEVNRQSFVYDLMELARSVAENLTFSFFFGWRERDTPIRSGNFIELRDGVCRLSPQFARSLIEFAAAPLRSSAERAAEDFVRRLRLQETGQGLTPTPKDVSRPSYTPGKRNAICEYCDGPMRGQGRRFCGRPCFLRWSVEVNRPIEKAQAKLAALRASGSDPSHGGEAAQKRGASNKAALSKTWAWRRSDAGQAEARRLRAEQARQRRKGKKP